MSIKSILGTEFQLSANQQMAIFAAAGLIIGAAASGKIPYPMGTEAAAPYIQSWANSIQFLWGIAGGPILMAFANSKPGPLAPPDPPVVQVATEKAKDMGQIAKALFIAILIIGAFGAFDHAHAATVHHGKALPNPLTPFTPPAAPVPGNLQTITIADLQNALADANAQPAEVVAPGDLAPTPFDATVTGGDVRHGNCWAALIKFDGAFTASQILPDHPGLALLQQKIFDAQKLTSKNLIPDYVAMACVNTFNDAGKNLADVIRALGIQAIAIPKI